MALVTISLASIDFCTGITLCQCNIAVDVPTVGQTAIGRSVLLASDSLPEDWTNAELCAAVAAALEVPVGDVTVALTSPAALVDTTVEDGN